jgi:AcrR family transcriptional regulator
MSDPNQRWGERAPTSREGARHRLVEAARTCLTRNGLAKTTIEDVAGEANVSRQTVYRYFANRDELLLAGVLAELQASQAVPDRSEEMARAARTPIEAVASLVEGVVHTLETIRTNPLLHSLLAAESDSMRAAIDGASQALFRLYADELRPWLVLGQDSELLRADVEPDEIAELLLRLTLSFITTEGWVHRDADDLRRFLITFLTPALSP